MRRIVLAFVVSFGGLPIALGAEYGPKRLRWLNSQAPSIVDVHYAWRSADESGQRAEEDRGDLRFDISGVWTLDDGELPTTEGRFRDANPFFASGGLRLMGNWGAWGLRLGTIVRGLSVSSTKSAEAFPELEDTPAWGAFSLSAGGALRWQSPEASWLLLSFGAWVVLESDAHTAGVGEGEVFATRFDDEDENYTTSGTEHQRTLLELRVPYVDALALVDGNGFRELKVRTPLAALVGTTLGPFAAATEGLANPTAGGYLGRLELADGLTVRGEPIAIRFEPSFGWDHGYAELAYQGPLDFESIDQLRVALGLSHTAGFDDAGVGFRVRATLDLGVVHVDAGFGVNYYEDLLLLAVPGARMARLGLGFAFDGAGPLDAP